LGSGKEYIVFIRILVFLQKNELVKNRKSIKFVIPAKVGIQLFQEVLDPGFRRGDDPRDFLRDHQKGFSYRQG
jgi:hypothetical protein